MSTQSIAQATTPQREEISITIAYPKCIELLDQEFMNAVINDAVGSHLQQSYELKLETDINALAIERRNGHVLGDVGESEPNGFVFTLSVPEKYKGVVSMAFCHATAKRMIPGLAIHCEMVIAEAVKARLAPKSPQV